MFVRPVHKSIPRHGSILVIVLMGLLVAGMLGVGLIKTVLIHQRQMRVLAGQQQAFYLAEAGVQRAIVTLAKTPEYHGETWKVPTDTLGASRTANVTIQVVKLDAETDEQEIRVQVQLENGHTQPTGYQRKHRILLPSPEPTESSESSE